jgi:predicted short-subunit dehydrogenase-like oxidoreductase (DUF2520 family)
LQEQRVLNLTIIGAGRVGQSLGKLLSQTKQVKVQYVVDLCIETASEAVDFIGMGTPLSSMETLNVTDLYLLSVVDGEIKGVSQKLSSLLDLSQSVVFHASGALASDILRETGASVASVHPIHSFAFPQLVVNEFVGTSCGMEGDSQALRVLEPLFSAIGGRCFHIDSEHKTIYHAGAVFASNFLPVLIESAVQCYVKAGLSRAMALELIEPLAKNSLDQIFRLGVRPAITGPASRGDLLVVDRHIKELDAILIAEKELYEMLTDRLMKLLDQPIESFVD